MINIFTEEDFSTIPNGEWWMRKCNNLLNERLKHQFCNENGSALSMLNDERNEHHNKEVLYIVTDLQSDECSECGRKHEPILSE